MESPKPGALFFLFAMRAGLDERFENRVQFVLRNAHAGVLHLNDERDVAAGLLLFPGDAHFDAALVGELDRVADEIDQNLPQPDAVQQQGVRQIFDDMTFQLEILFWPPVRKTSVCTKSQISRRSVGSGRSSITPASIFDMSRMSLMSSSNESALERMDCRYCRCLGSRKSFCNNSLKPRMAFIGVRISWLMLARKVVFSWLLCSA